LWRYHLAPFLSHDQIDHEEEEQSNLKMHLCQALFGHVPRLFRKKNYMWADEHPNKDHADPISSFL
jgi:hypothetical protein